MPMVEMPPDTCCTRMMSRASGTPRDGAMSTMASLGIEPVPCSPVRPMQNALHGVAHGLGGDAGNPANSRAVEPLALSTRLDNGRSRAWRISMPPASVLPSWLPATAAARDARRRQHESFFGDHMERSSKACSRLAAGPGRPPGAPGPSGVLLSIVLLGLS